MQNTCQIYDSINVIFKKLVDIYLGQFNRLIFEIEYSKCQDIYQIDTFQLRLLEERYQSQYQLNIEKAKIPLILIQMYVGQLKTLICCDWTSRMPRYKIPLRLIYFINVSGQKNMWVDSHWGIVIEQPTCQDTYQIDYLINLLFQRIS